MIASAADEAARNPEVAGMLGARKENSLATFGKGKAEVIPGAEDFYICALAVGG